MGVKKKLSSEKRREANKDRVFARLNDCPTSPRKMRLVADMIRGLEVEKALFTLKHSSKEASGRLETLLISAISNWQNKFEDQRVEEAGLYIKEIQVNSGRMLKRVQPAPQGRAHRIRKRSNHVILEVAAREQVEETNTLNEQSAE